MITFFTSVILPREDSELPADPHVRFQERDELLHNLVVTESSVAVFDHLHHAK